MCQARSLYLTSAEEPAGGRRQGRLRRSCLWGRRASRPGWYRPLPRRSSTMPASQSRARARDRSNVLNRARFPVPEPAPQGAPGTPPQLGQEGLGPLDTAPAPGDGAREPAPVPAAARGGLHAAQPLLQRASPSTPCWPLTSACPSAWGCAQAGPRPGPAPAPWSSSSASRATASPWIGGHHPLPGEEQHAGRPGGAHEPASG